MNIILGCMGIAIAIVCIINAYYLYKELNFKNSAIQLTFAIFCFIIAILYLLN